MLILISGTVKYYNSERGFGLLTRDDGEKDVRFLLSALKQAGLTRVNERQKVTFDLFTDPDTGKVTASAFALA